MPTKTLQRLLVSRFSIRISETKQVYRVARAQEPQLVEGTDFLAFIGRVGNAMSKEQNLHGNNRTTWGPNHLVTGSGSFFHMRMALSNFGFTGEKFGTVFRLTKKTW